MNTNNNDPQQQQPAITPELLVDALSGHEDGLLAIAERLMLSYDSGYDAMGEAIIDAFADVQRLFQHVVEAAHMEGAAFESARREEEWREVAERVERERGVRIFDELGLAGDAENDASGNKEGASGNLPHRHEELIDQDVRDVLLSAIRKSHSLLSLNKHEECRALYERACHSASALLPVDSDHRGRLQLATARAESMSPDRSCAILRYAMDDVLRSGLSLREGRYREEGEKRRGDCVLRRVDPLMGAAAEGAEREWNGSRSRDFEESASGVDHNHHALGGAFDATTTTVEQSADEALASLVEEMKEILQAPVYATTPLLFVSDKFWMALGEAKKSQLRKEERLEQALAKIKADFLLAREEWEEQLAQEREKTEAIKRKFNDLKLKSDLSMQRQRSGESSQTESDPTTNSINTPNRSHAAYSNNTGSGQGGIASPYHFSGFSDNNNRNSLESKQNRNKHMSSGSSVVSIGSEFAQRAKSLVHLINCQGGERDGEFSPLAGGGGQRGGQRQSLR
ncbi:hypothetical protein HJC23_012849 [Cyclotella cryptica]|uniref:Uncharacterized protein n=1 Tax=Cyclotella cryptica TaxID=29204 RepID=A0ABD3Q1H1_9STRA|eukprot:CCRYP_009440-RA/>CCRYP_009440-RA protein AED:0.06 eAED:0.07 QI:0/1/0.5/1/1/1/2/413/512